MTHQAAIRSFVAALSRGQHDLVDIDDVMQELWVRCTEIDPDSVRDPKSYLFRMAQNMVLDRFRQVARHRAYDADWGYVHNRTYASNDPATAERALLARERLTEIEAGLQSVGARAALVFRRYRIDGVHQHLIAEELGVSLSTVEKDLRRAYQAVVGIANQGDEE